MARPTVKEPKQQYTVMLKPSTVKEIDSYAEKFGLTRSQLMGNLMENALDETKVLEKVGLFKAVIISEKIMQKFKEALFTGKVSLDKKGDIEIKK
jgi:hypothetical protein